MQRIEETNTVYNSIADSIRIKNSVSHLGSPSSAALGGGSPSSGPESETDHHYSTARSQRTTEKLDAQWDSMTSWSHSGMRAFRGATPFVEIPQSVGNEVLHLDSAT